MMLKATIIERLMNGSTSENEVGEPEAKRAAS